MGNQDISPKKCSTLSPNEKILYVANGLSDDLSIIDTKERKVITSVAVGMVPYGILIDD